MNKRIAIKSVKVQNFRSLRNELIEVKDINIFVGLNDAGKSNFLKALNLFFTGNTDYGEAFNFQKDFSNLFPEKTHRTKEIVIEIKFIIPDTYKEKGIFTWKKIWRTNDYTDEVILNENGEKPSERSRVPGTLKRIKYRYVPAVKSKEYYKSLLSELYLTVSAVLNSPLEQSVKDFSQVIQEYTKQISEEVSRKIGIDSMLTIPENLSELFRTLIFKTTNKNGKNSVSLDLRGDGIQVRHIPIILKYIADEDQKTRNQGSMKISTIWGFEEPENGVELSKAFEMANEFLLYANDIQMFITTHSPAFYMNNSDEKTRVFFVTQSDRNEGTKVSISATNISIGERMGLMPIVAPYIAEQEKKMSAYKKLLKENAFYDVPTIMVEGKTDKQYLELAIKIFSPELKNLLDKKELRIFTREEYGGCKKVIEWVYAWIFSGNMSKIVALFDKDEAGRLAKEELENSQIFKSRRDTAAIKIQFLQPSSDIIYLLNNKLDVYYEIEHLLSCSCWRELKTNNYVEPKKSSELYKMTAKILTRDKTIDSVLDEVVDRGELLETIVTCNPCNEKKEKIFLYVSQRVNEGKIEFLDGFKKTIDKLKRIFYY